MDPSTTNTYTLNPQYKDVSLNELIRGQYNIPFNTGALANFLKISDKVNLPTSFELSPTASPFAPNTDEAKALSKLYGLGTSARQKAIAPAVSSLEASLPEQAQKFQTERTRLESEKDPLKQRYQLVLDELKRRESRDTGEVNTALAREFGRRGIPLSSGLYDETGIEKRRPVSEFYGIQGRETGATYEENLRNITNLINQLTPQETEANRVIRNAIAQLQSGAGNAAIDDAFNQLKFMEEQRQFNENSTLQKSQQDINRKLAEAQIAKYNRPEEEDWTKAFTTLGEGQTLFNLLSGKPVYTNPKTYKPTGSGADNNGWGPD